MDGESARSAVGRDPREFDCRRGSADRGEGDCRRRPTLDGWRTHRSHSLGNEPMAHRSDQDRIEKTHNLPKFFVEHPQVSWVLLVGVLVWGWFGYHSMPQRKDPDIPVRVAVASCSWPGATAQQVEQFVTRPIEDAVAENKTI